MNQKSCGSVIEKSKFYHKLEMRHEFYWIYCQKMVDIVHYHRFTCVYKLNEIKFLFHSMMGKVTYRLGVSVWRDIN